MKKLLLLCSLSLVGFHLKAQDGAHIGAHGLFNTAWIINQNSYGAEEFDYTLKTALGGGLVLGYNFTDHIGLQAELNSVKMGQNYESSKGTGEVRKYNLSYISIPLLFKYTSGEGIVKFYGQIGPQFNFLGSANIVYTDTNATSSTTVDAKDRFSKSDIGLNFGLGANISIIPQLYVNAGLTFYYGFNDINSAEASNAPGTFADGTWRWPDKSKNKYEPSHNGTGGLDIGLHYMFLR